jgi:hypothetical protein
MKDAILEAFVLLGDVQGLVGWARTHPTDFYCKVLPKVLPKQVELSGAEDSDIPLNLTISFVEPSR